MATFNILYMATTYYIWVVMAGYLTQSALPEQS